MKLTAIAAIFALILLSACGSENAHANETCQPVDEWTPFVQVAPPGNIWETQTYEAADDPPATRSSSPNYDWVSYRSFEVSESHWQRIFYEQQRAFNFFFPDATGFYFSTGQVYPDFFGGFWGTYFYTAVLIVEGKEDDAAEFLAYIENLETVEVYFVMHSFNELAAVHNQIINSNVQPQLWFVSWDVLEGYVQVQLFDYSEEEMAFFREYVIDSPLVRFFCVFEVHGNNVLIHFPFYNPVFSPPIHENQLEGVSISSHVYDDQAIVTHVYVDSEMDPLPVRYVRLKYYNNNRWIPLLGYNPSIFVSEPDLLFSPGLNTHVFKTAHFTRNFEGFHKVEFLVTAEDLFDWNGFHLLSYIFHN